jgi:hypothetical protein
MKVEKDEVQKFPLPERLHELVKQNIDNIAMCQQNINNLVSGYLADKPVPEGVEISLSADGRDILLNPLK